MINPPNPQAVSHYLHMAKSQKKYSIYLREVKEKRTVGAASEARDDNSCLQAPRLCWEIELSHCRENGVPGTISSCQPQMPELRIT